MHVIHAPGPPAFLACNIEKGGSGLVSNKKNTSCYHMHSTVDKSIPIENVHCLAHFLYCGDIFPYRTPLSHSAFSPPSSTITMDTTDTMHALMINQLLRAVKYHSLPRQYCIRVCGTRAIVP